MINVPSLPLAALLRQDTEVLRGEVQETMVEETLVQDLVLRVEEVKLGTSLSVDDFGTNLQIFI